MKDLSALTAKTGDEFAMFTSGSKRLIIRGNAFKVDVNDKIARELNSMGYKWSGHTHPGYNLNFILPSEGDKYILSCFKQKTTVIYNSKGQFKTFGKE